MADGVRCVGAVLRLRRTPLSLQSRPGQPALTRPDIYFQDQMRIAMFICSVKTDSPYSVWACEQPYFAPQSPLKRRDSWASQPTTGSTSNECGPRRRPVTARAVPPVQPRLHPRSERRVMCCYLQTYAQVPRRATGVYPIWINRAKTCYKRVHRHDRLCTNGAHQTSARALAQVVTPHRENPRHAA